MSIQKKSLNSKPAKTQKAGVSKKLPSQRLTATKSVSLKPVYIPPDPCNRG
jgi:hypothetical protein